MNYDIDNKNIDQIDDSILKIVNDIKDYERIESERNAVRDKKIKQETELEKLQINKPFTEQQEYHTTLNNLDTSIKTLETKMKRMQEELDAINDRFLFYTDAQIKEAEKYIEEENKEEVIQIPVEQVKEEEIIQVPVAKEEQVPNQELIRLINNYIATFNKLNNVTLKEQEDINNTLNMIATEINGYSDSDIKAAEEYVKNQQKTEGQEEIIQIPIVTTEKEPEEVIQIPVEEIVPNKELIELIENSLNTIDLLKTASEEEEIKLNDRLDIINEELKKYNDSETQAAIKYVNEKRYSQKEQSEVQEEQALDYDIENEIKQLSEELEYALEENIHSKREVVYYTTEIVEEYSKQISRFKKLIINNNKEPEYLEEKIQEAESRREYYINILGSMKLGEEIIQEPAEEVVEEQTLSNDKIAVLEQETLSTQVRISELEIVIKDIIEYKAFLDKEANDILSTMITKNSEYMDILNSGTNTVIKDVENIGKDELKEKIKTAEQKQDEYRIKLAQIREELAIDVDIINTPAEAITAEESKLENEIETEQETKPRSLEEIMVDIYTDKETGRPIGLTETQSKRYDRSNISVTKDFVNEVAHGQALYNVTSITSGTLHLPINIVSKLTGKLLTTERTKAKIEKIKENVRNLSPEEKEVLIKEQLNTLNKKSITPGVETIIKEAAKKWKESEIKQTRLKTSTMYNDIFEAYKLYQKYGSIIDKLNEGLSLEVIKNIPEYEVSIEKMTKEDLIQALEEVQNQVIQGKAKEIKEYQKLNEEIQQFENDTTTGDVEEREESAIEIEKLNEAIDKDLDLPALLLFVKHEQIKYKESKDYENVPTTARELVKGSIELDKELYYSDSSYEEENRKKTEIQEMLQTEPESNKINHSKTQ